MRNLLIVISSLLLICSCHKENSVAWKLVPSGTTNDLFYIYFKDSHTGFATGRNGTLLKTINGGENWNSQSIGSTELLSSIFFIDNTGYVVGTSYDSYYPRGSIYKTDNGGENWMRQKKINGNINSIFFTDVNTGYAVGWDSVGNGIILNTISGGTSWTTKVYGKYQNEGNSIFFTDHDIGYCVGSGILKTINAGISWTEQASGISHGWLLSQYFIDKQFGYTVGDHIILKTINGGENWTVQNLDVVKFPDTFQRSAMYNSVFFTDINTGYIVGYNTDVTRQEIILKSIDGGVNWKSISRGEKGILHSVFFTNSQTGFVVGDNGTILKTNSAGE